jgi:hypothetical protein
LPLQQKDKDINILADFSACMFEYEDKEKFEIEFAILRTKVEKQTWLDSIYKLKEKLVECYMKHVYTLRMWSTQLSESLNNDLKIYFKSNFDIIRFLNHFKRVVQKKEITSWTQNLNQGKNIEDRNEDTYAVATKQIVHTYCIWSFQAQNERYMTTCTKIPMKVFQAQYEMTKQQNSVAGTNTKGMPEFWTSAL